LPLRTRSMAIGRNNPRHAAATGASLRAWPHCDTKRSFTMLCEHELPCQPLANGSCTRQQHFPIHAVGARVVLPPVRHNSQWLRRAWLICASWATELTSLAAHSQVGRGQLQPTPAAHWPLTKLHLHHNTITDPLSVHATSSLLRAPVPRQAAPWASVIIRTSTPTDPHLPRGALHHPPCIASTAAHQSPPPTAANPAAPQ
jgi:hypothetical protein